MRFSLALALLTATASAQFTLQQSNSTASFRGIYAVSDSLAWASGTNGTVLRTVDAGEHWLACAVPLGAEKLDFRGIQAFDDKTAIVMSSGKGDASRIYKTGDGCKHWKLAITNTEPEGFWDALHSDSSDHVWVMGDSINGKSVMLEIRALDDAEPELEMSLSNREVDRGISSFAASNSTLLILKNDVHEPGWKYSRWWAGDTPEHAYVYRLRQESNAMCRPCQEFTDKVEVPMAQGVSTAGIFSLAFRPEKTLVAIGGDYKAPESPIRTAAWSSDYGKTWTLSTKPPHGYRSSVAWSNRLQAFLTVGPNGTDISYDNGRTWQSVGADPERSNDWNALSLPFVVGPKGRIGRLNPADFPKKPMRSDR
ncbi:beta propeller repeat protein [Terriglobus albidus]|uniref:glycosyl hydrolase n=1 Tax=Terriglobus albidus TaxID=1592106 RepID=UPI0021E0A223|nr:glycosyl hydrolase [Terriglobus albidus]